MKKILNLIILTSLAILPFLIISSIENIEGLAPFVIGSVVIVMLTTIGVPITLALGIGTVLGLAVEFLPFFQKFSTFLEGMLKEGGLDLKKIFTSLIDYGRTGDLIDTIKKGLENLSTFFQNLFRGTEVEVGPWLSIFIAALVIAILTIIGVPIILAGAIGTGLGIAVQYLPFLKEFFQR